VYCYSHFGSPLSTDNLDDTWLTIPAFGAIVLLLSGSLAIKTVEQLNTVEFEVFHSVDCV
jgi:hypothetical protein